MALAVGAMAPDFERPAVTGQDKHTFRLRDYRGRHVVLAFYPLNWTPV